MAGDCGCYGVLRGCFGEKVAGDHPGGTGLEQGSLAGKSSDLLGAGGGYLEAPFTGASMSLTAGGGVPI